MIPCCCSSSKNNNSSNNNNNNGPKRKNNNNKKKNILYLVLTGLIWYFQFCYVPLVVLFNEQQQLQQQQLQQSGSHHRYQSIKGRRQQRKQQSLLLSSLKKNQSTEQTLFVIKYPSPWNNNNNIINHHNDDPNNLEESSNDDNDDNFHYDNNHHYDSYPYFRGCLLIMDDNHLLPEWLAYHYTVLPLRRLIVAIDPNSQTSPHKIFKRFRPYIDITEWTDDDYHFQVDPNDTAIHNHRIRQKYFIRGCLKQLKNEQEMEQERQELEQEQEQQKLEQQQDQPLTRRNYSAWVSFLDTDEYVVPNWKARDSYKIQKYHPENMTITNSSTSTNSSSSITILDIMNDNPQFHPLQISPNLYPCFPKDRFSILSIESSPEQVYHNVPTGINATLLMTLRYRYSTGGNHYNHHGKHKIFSKSFIDLSQINIADIRSHNHAVHRPIKSICPDTILNIPFEQSPLVVYHYAGTLQSFLFRKDPRTARRNATVYYERFGGGGNTIGNNNNATTTAAAAAAAAAFGAYPDDSARFWITNFVHQMKSIDKANELLAGAGEIQL